VFENYEQYLDHHRAKAEGWTASSVSLISANYDLQTWVTVGILFRCVLVAAFEDGDAFETFRRASPSSSARRRRPTSTATSTRSTSVPSTTTGDSTVVASVTGDRQATVVADCERVGVGRPFAPAHARSPR